MTSKAQTEKWITVCLGIVCLGLVINLFRSGSTTESARPATPASAQAASGRTRNAAAGAADELARYDPAIHTDLFKAIRERPEPKPGRDPFEFVVHEAPPIARDRVATNASGPVVPPPPPPPPLKAVGYSEKGDGVREAIVTHQDELFIVHEGETFAKRFQVVRISPTQVEISDATTQQNIRLPIGQ